MVLVCLSTFTEANLILRAQSRRLHLSDMAVVTVELHVGGHTLVPGPVVKRLVECINSDALAVLVVVGYDLVPPGSGQ